MALTDILGAEDAFGDMDFKVAGTKEFVTALQLDTKLDGIPASVLAGALTQARDARLAILEVMAEAIDRPDEMSVLAPRIITVNIPVDKIGEVIGPKGKMINQIQDDTGADITIEDDGTIYIGATNGEAAEAARAAINAIANPTMPEVGERYLGTVVKTTTFGAFVSLLPGKDGLLHISELKKLAPGRKRIDNVEDVAQVGQKILVEIKEIDPRGKLSLMPVIEEASRRRGCRGVVRRGRGLTHMTAVTPGPWSIDQDQEPGSTVTLLTAGAGRAGPPDRPARRPAHHHRARAGRALGGVRHLGRRRLARRDRRPDGLGALPRAPAVQGHPPAGGDGDLLADRRGRRGDERLHLQGAHLLLRPGPRPRPAPGDRRDLRHRHLGAAAARGRRRRARRDPRGDRHARRRSLRPGP